MYNPTRINKNIGTAKQGYGQDNEMTIPYSYAKQKSFYENFADYKTVKKVINGQEFLFIIEQTRPGYEHACSIDDITKVIAHIPSQDYGDLKFFVLRQPKRKEEILSPAWGRWIPSYSFKNESRPAIIIEAQDYTKILKWDRRLAVEDWKELERMGIQLLIKGEITS